MASVPIAAIWTQCHHDMDGKKSNRSIIALTSVKQKDTMLNFLESPTSAWNNEFWPSNLARANSDGSEGHSELRGQGAVNRAHFVFSRSTRRPARCGWNYGLDKHLWRDFDNHRIVYSQGALFAKICFHHQGQANLAELFVLDQPASTQASTGNYVDSW